MNPLKLAIGMLDGLRSTDHYVMETYTLCLRNFLVVWNSLPLLNDSTPYFGLNLCSSITSVHGSWCFQSPKQAQLSSTQMGPRARGEFLGSLIGFSAGETSLGFSSFSHMSWYSLSMHPSSTP